MESLHKQELAAWQCETWRHKTTTLTEERSVLKRIERMQEQRRRKRVIEKNVTQSKTGDARRPHESEV